MRGLDNEERHCLASGEGPQDPELLGRLAVRGLVAVSVCDDCGAMPSCCDCPIEYFENTAAGELALRLDAAAAARAVAGVTT